MISHFAFRALAVRGRPSPGAAPAPLSPADPLAELLASLRGREVTVLVGSREIVGKVVLADPVTLVGPAGQVTVVAPGQVLSVQF